ncbi:MAG: hypothetical protein LUD14_11725 [Clostridiales bacterium]|nr:hypothetical protein [Clostridiales bacterium]
MLVQKLMLCLPAGAAAAFVMELTAYFKPWMRVHVWAAAAIGVSAVTALIWWLMRRPDVRTAALALDRTGLKERTITALELLDDDSFFAEIQKKDAWEHLSGVKPRKRLPVAVSRKNIGLFATFCAAFIICAAAPSPAKEEAKLQYQVSKAAKEEAEKIEETAEELEEKAAAGELTEEENEAVQELLLQLQEELSEVQTQEDLEKALERAAYKLSEAKSETDNLSVQESVEQLAQALDTEMGSDSDTQTADADLFDELSDADPEALSETEELAETAEELLEQLEDADISTLSEEELKELAETLEALAQAANGSSLAQQLSEAAAGAASGQLSAEQIAAALSAASSVKQQTQTLLAAAGDLDANSSISSKSSSGTSENNSGGTGGSGSGNGDCSGNGNGSGDGTGGGWNYGSKNGTEENGSYSGEIVSVPDTVGDDENLTGEAGDGTTYSSAGSSLMWSGNRITYDQVIGSYTEQAMSEIESANYPGGLQDLIKSYFSDLNGE